MFRQTRLPYILVSAGERRERLVLDCLRGMGMATCKRISTVTGIDCDCVVKLLRGLQERDLVEEGIIGNIKLYGLTRKSR